MEKFEFYGAPDIEREMTRHGMVEAGTARKKTTRYWDRDVEYEVETYSGPTGRPVRVYALKGNHGWTGVLPPGKHDPSNLQASVPRPLPGGSGKTAKEALRKTVELLKKQGASGKKMKAESATSNLRAELDERIKVIGISGRDKKKPIKPGPMKGGSVKKGCSCEGMKDELAELYPHLAE